MAATLDSTTTMSGLSASISAGSNSNRVLILLANRSTSGLTSATYGGASMVQYGTTITDGSGNYAMQIWYIINPAINVNTLAVSHSLSESGVLVFSNADQSAPMTGVASGSSASGYSASAIGISTTAGSGAYTFGVCNVTTGILSVTGTAIGANFSQYKSGTGSVNLTWNTPTGSGDSYAAIIASIKEYVAPFSGHKLTLLGCG
jgi:hypothetical protein